jgi:magnesium chelatase accessory protein
VVQDLDAPPGCEGLTAPDWNRDGADWPNRAASRFVEAGGLRWHVQDAGNGPGVLLIHGTGAATHTWRDVLPLLAARARVVAPDLPGHGFSASPAPERLGLEGMAGALGDLVRAVGLDARVVVGHSAGAAILAWMCLERAIEPDALVALNGAMLPLGGLRTPLLSPLTRRVVGWPAVPRWFSEQAADPRRFHALLAKTGSVIDRQGEDLYRRLVDRPRHVAAALGMMAHWDVRELERRLPALRTPLLLVCGDHDAMIPRPHALAVRRLVPSARIVDVKDTGHLAHEERPDAIVALIADLLAGPRPRTLAVAGGDR